MTKNLSYRRLYRLARSFGHAALIGEVPMVEGFDPKNERYKRDVAETWAVRFVEYCYKQRKWEI